MSRPHLPAKVKDQLNQTLGQTHSDREAIRKRFREMYGVRSKLVHGRTARLNLPDVRELHYAQGLLSDVLTDEANKLLKWLKAQKQAQ